MNGKKDSIEINIPANINAELQETRKKSVVLSLYVKDLISSVWKFCKEDKNRVLFSVKAGLAVVLVSLLILCEAPYRVFGTNIIWSILTVAVMFEYTVGATFNRGFNRALGSIMAGILGIGIGQLALSVGRVAEPIIIGLSIFIVGAVSSFMKLWPSLVPYEYGFRVLLFTYCLIVVSGYRIGNPIRTAFDRLYSIAIGGTVAVVVNVLIFPIWAGEQLHNELVNYFNSVADALEECVKKYLEEDGSGHDEFLKTLMDEFPDEPAYRKCRSTLNSAAKLENLANSAKWELPHGRFNHFSYPWAEYVKVGAVLRFCAYEVMALHGVLHSEIQAPYNLRITFQNEIQEATSQAAELVRSLGKDILDMQRSLKTFHLKRLHKSTECLRRAIDAHSYLCTSAYDPPSIVLSSQLARLENNQHEHKLNSKPQFPLGQKEVQVAFRRLYSWPSREVDAFEEGGFGSGFIPRMQASESAITLSLATFTSLLIEFVARLNHLVEAVDELSKMAKFKQEIQ